MSALDRSAPVFVAGHRGVVGQALVRRLEQEGFCNLILRSRVQVDLTDESAVSRLFASAQPAAVFVAAAKVGGIAANISEPVEFLVKNLQIQNNLLLAARTFAVETTVFLGSSCIYPREAPQPMREEYFMTGPLEPTNESYALAKIAGIRLAKALYEESGTKILCPMPCNVYGPGDHFEFERSHVLSALVRRFCEAEDRADPSVALWGTGKARREFLHVDDLADACLFLAENVDSPDLINIGSGEDQSIAELATMVSEAVGYQGEILWDTSKPDGMPQKLLDVSAMRRLGWSHSIDLRDGIRQVLADFRARMPHRSPL